MMDTKAVILSLFLLYLERCIAVGKVVDDCQGLLKSGASNTGVCYQLTHRLDDLRWTDDCEHGELEKKNDCSI